MKKYVSHLMCFLFISASALSGCTSTTSKQEPPLQGEQYQCPMKCTEEKFEKPGACPVCKMDLEKVANS